jgi:hypothetical protein
MIEQGLDTRTAARRNGDISSKMGSDPSFPVLDWERLIAPYRRRLG